MSFNEKTGRISATPRHRFPASFSHTFEVYGYNSAGMTACRILLEVIGGSWNLVTLRVSTVGVPDATGIAASPEGSVSDAGASSQYSEVQSAPEVEDLSPGSRASASPLPPHLARACRGPAGEASWEATLDKVAALLYRFGRSTEVLGLGATLRVVKGLSVAALLPLLGLPDNEEVAHFARRLVRLVEHRGRVPRHDPDGTLGSGCRGVDFSLGITSREPGSVLDAVVFLSREAGPQEAASRAVELGAWDRTTGRWPAPESSRSGRRAHSRGASKDTARVNEDFARLLPFWRERLREKPSARQKAVAAWRSCRS